jgi:hypothetical protein
MKQVLIIFVLSLIIFGCGSSSGDNSSAVSITSNHKNLNYTTLSKGDDNYIEFIKTIGINGLALDVALSGDGDYLYVASGDFGLQVIDISDKYSPKLIGTYDSYGFVNHVEVIDNIVYLSYIAQTWDDYERINAYDVTHPENAIYLGYHEGYKSDNHKKVDTIDELYYISNKDFVVVNKKKNSYQSYKLYDPYALAVCKGYAYIANGREGVSMFKVLNLSHSSLTNP